MNKKIKKLLTDKFMAGVLLGILANFPKQILDFILYNIDFSKFFCWHTTSGVLVSKEWIYDNIHGIILGAAMDFFFAGLIGTLIVYFLYYLGENRYLFIKGVAFSIFIWIALCIVIVDHRISMYVAPLDPWHIYHSFMVHTVHGVVVSYLAVKYARNTITR